jgi:hypothetical protein
MFKNGFRFSKYTAAAREDQAHAAAHGGYPYGITRYLTKLVSISAAAPLGFCVLLIKRPEIVGAENVNSFFIEFQ